MSTFVTRQPNGKLCRFSRVVDTVTHWNLTEEEYIELCAEEAREEARRLLRNRLPPFELVLRDFIPTNDTVENFNRILKEMGYEKVWKEERR